MSVENSLKWSWSFALLAIQDALGISFCRFPRMVGYMIPQTLVDYFDITILQNADSIKLVKQNHRKIIARMGGMHVDERNPGTRYDDQLKKVGHIIATTEQFKKIAQRCNKNVTLIPNGVDLEKFKPIPRPDRKFTVGFAGNTWGTGKIYKGYKLYCQVTSRLQIKHRECLFNHSQIPHEDMPKKFYHKIDCLIMPSLGEGCSNVTLEALACGVPVIITKVGFHGEKLKNFQNCIFVKRDVKEIMRAVRLLKASPTLWKKLSKNGRIFAEKYHDIKDTAIRYRKVIDSIIENMEE